MKNKHTVKRVVTFNKAGLSLEEISFHTQCSEDEIEKIIAHNKLMHNPHLKQEIIGVHFGWKNSSYNSEAFYLNELPRYSFFELSESEQQIFIDRIGLPIKKFWQ